ncbi:MAG: hypothetical protein Q7J16_13065 [Candidatus Cloacimonadales bacterium]|nr:hypothetical protein [Candidatus Cloacimonadales bacterium]
MHNQISSGKDFAIESTLSGRSLIKIFQQLKFEKYRIIVLYIFLDCVKIAVDRVRVRVEEGGHHIPTEDLQRRYSRSFNNFWNIYNDLADEWQIFYNGEDNVIQTAFGAKQEFKIIDESKFDLFMRGLDVKNNEL